MPGTQLGGIYIIIYINSIKSPGTLFTHKSHISTTISSARIRALMETISPLPFLPYTNPDTVPCWFRDPVPE